MKEETKYLQEKRRLDRNIEELSITIDKIRKQKNYMEHSPAEWDKTVNPDTVSQEDIHIQSPLAYDAFEEEEEEEEESDPLYENWINK